MSFGLLLLFVFSHNFPAQLLTSSKIGAGFGVGFCLLERFCYFLYLAPSVSGDARDGRRINRFVFRYVCFTAYSHGSGYFGMSSFLFRSI